MSHHCIDWIPEELFNQCRIMWTLDHGRDEHKYEAPTIWFEHGVPDHSISLRRQYHDDIYYLCNNDWTYNHLKSKGLQAYHVGHIYFDRTIPERRNPKLFVYVPQHSLFENDGMPKEWNQPPLTKTQLEDYCKEYECENFITSIVDDTQRELYYELNPMYSNRYDNFGSNHFQKCKYLYENAKIIYTDLMSTFDITAEAHGIPIIGRDKQRLPYMFTNYGKINVLVDGKSCTRIVETLEKIIKEHK
jgi:hypothetical protein